jgi:hypothetical protein
VIGTAKPHAFVPADVCAVCVQPEAADVHATEWTVVERDPVDQPHPDQFAVVDGKPTAPRRSTDSQRVMNRARNLAARWVREKHPDVWELLVDQAADELGIERQ